VPELSSFAPPSHQPGRIGHDLHPTYSADDPITRAELDLRTPGYFLLAAVEGVWRDGQYQTGKVYVPPDIKPLGFL
jgi:hypothetical protein